MTTQVAAEDLPRMSFGEHLEELRGRLFKAIGAIALAVIGLMPFKREVQAIYLEPYRACWNSTYAGFLEQLDRDIGLVGDYARLGPEQKQQVDARVAQLHADRQRTVRFHLERRGQILAGTYPRQEADRILHEGNFPLPWNLKALGGLDDIWIFMAATMLFGVILASPIVLWQIWAFIAAGLYARERKVVWAFLPAAFGLLGLGVLFGYYVAVPFGLYMLVQYMNLDQVAPFFTVSQYFSFFFSFCTALGLMFQLPLVMLVLARIGLVTHATMKQHWRYVVLIIFVVAMVVTPPDPFSMCLMAAPLLVLYGFGLLLTARVQRPAVAG